MINGYIFKFMFWFQTLSFIVILITSKFGVRFYFQRFILNIKDIFLFAGYQEMSILSLSFAEYIRKVLFEEIFNFYSIQSTIE